jgi:uncharacterized protein (DUF849 family)
MLQVALNGGRTSGEHPRIPRTPDELAAAARSSVEAGARALHLHPYDPDGRQTVEAEPCAAAIRRVREECPGIPISLSTSAAIEADPDRRYALIERWTELPDLVTANQGEDGIVNLCELLISKGIGIEAGILSPADAEAFADSGLAHRCVRAMVEPLDNDPDQAVRDAAEMERTLTAARIELEQVHHGEGVASWTVSVRGLARGHGIRTGLEDTVYLPDGRLAHDNASLTRIAAAMIS